MDRRKFLKQSFWGLTGLSVLGAFYTWQVEPFLLEFVRIKMPIKNLPDHLQGKTLMQISDIHVGKRFDHNFIIKSFKEAAKFEPDFVVYTGDYITLYSGKVLFNVLDEVLQHAVKGKLGTVGILGNHDYGISWQEADVADNITQMLQNNGIPLLRNQQMEMHGLNFIGFDDLWAKKLDAKKAMKNFNPSKANLALCHNPDACDLNIWKNFEGWILSGHTHGGQCKPPFLPAPMLPVQNKRYAAGKIDLENNKTLYVNRALGHLHQVRFNVRPEITIFELEKG